MLVAGIEPLGLIPMHHGPFFQKAFINLNEEGTEVAVVTTAKVVKLFSLIKSTVARFFILQ